MDDTYSDPVDKTQTRIVALTGVRISVSRYAELRDKFYAHFQSEIAPSQNRVNLKLSELRGNDMPGGSDEEKVSKYRRVVDFVVENQIPIIRAGQYETEAMRRTFAGDSRLKGMTWLQVLFLLDRSGWLTNEVLIPVMDSCEGDTPKYSRQVQSMNLIRSTGRGSMLSIKHSANIVGEVFYADSCFSPFTQVADVVAYLRLVGDYNRHGRCRAFKQKLLPLCERLDEAIAFDCIEAMTLDGVVQAPNRDRPDSRV